MTLVLTLATALLLAAALAFFAFTFASAPDAGRVNVVMTETMATVRAIRINLITITAFCSSPDAMPTPVSQWC